MKKNGFVFVDSAFSLEDVRDFEATIIKLAKELLIQVGHSPLPSNPYEILRTLETKYKDEFFLLCSQVGCSSAGWSLACSPNLRARLKEISGAEVAPALFVQPIGVFYNEPDVTRLQTAPHHPYTMLVRPRSITQLTTPKEIVDKFEPVLCNLKRGDAVIFDHNCIHSTAPNYSPFPRVSAVIRFVDLVAEKPFKPWVQFSYSGTDIKHEISERAISTTIEDVVQGRA